MDAQDRLARRINAARTQAGMTQNDLAIKLGVSRPAVTQWESRDLNRRSHPSLAMIMGIARETGFSLEDLIGEASKLDVFARLKDQTLSDALNLGLGSLPTKRTYSPLRGAEPLSGTPLNEIGNPRYSGRGIAPPKGGLSTLDSYRRLADAFKKSLEFEFMIKPGNLERHFDYVMQRGAIRVNVDYFDGNNIVEFSMYKGNLRLQEKLGQLLLAEKVHGRAVKKHLIYWSPDEEDISDFEGLFNSAKMMNITVSFVRHPTQAIEYLRALE